MTKSIETIVLGLSPELKALPGDFATKVEAGKLLFPESVYSCLTNNGEYRTLLELVSAHDAFPSSLDAVARELGWNKADVDTAYKKLLDSVTDHLPKDPFIGQPRRNYEVVIPSQWLGKTWEEIQRLRRD